MSAHPPRNHRRHCYLRTTRACFAVAAVALLAVPAAPAAPGDPDRTDPASLPASVNTPAFAKDMTSDSDSWANTSQKGSSIGRYCVKQGLRVKIKRSEIQNPGNKKKQLMITEFRYLKMPEKCHFIKREGKARLQLEIPTKDNRWFTIGGTKNQVFPVNIANGDAGKGAAFFAAWVHGRNPKHAIYRCKPGPGKTRGRTVYMQTAKNRRTGRVAGRRLVRVPMKVERDRGITAEDKKNGAVPGAC